MRYWHIAHPTWQPGEPLRCRDNLLADGHELPWLWEAPDGTDGEIVCLFPDTEEGREEATWLHGDRPDYQIVRIDLPDDYDMTRAYMEPYPAVYGEIPAGFLTVTDTIAGDTR